MLPSFEAVLLIFSIPVILTFIAAVNSQEPDCTESYKKCENTYKQNILQALYQKDISKVCSTFLDFTRCLRKLQCISNEAKDDTILIYNESLRSYNITCGKPGTLKSAKLAKATQQETTVRFTNNVTSAECGNADRSCVQDYQQTWLRFNGTKHNKTFTEIGTYACQYAEVFFSCEKKKAQCSGAQRTVCREFHRRKIYCVNIDCPGTNGYSSASVSLKLSIFFLLETILGYVLL